MNPPPDTSIGERIDEIEKAFEEGRTADGANMIEALLTDTLRSVKLPEKKPAEPLDDTEDEQFYEELGFNQGISEAQEALNQKIREVENG